MRNLVEEQLIRRQKAKRLDTAQRYGMTIFIGIVILFSICELVV